MLTVLLRNVRTDETLDLADISQNGEGVEAVSGLTGFGLPPVTVQWFEGAGDGAQARGYRVNPRDIDIPLYVEVTNRAELKTTLATLSRVVAGAFLIELYEDGVLDRYTEVYRVGGGTYTYGTDTTGERTWQSIITVRAGNPYWLAAEDTTVVRAYDDVDTFTITNNGSAPAKPVWTIEGPFTDVEVVHESGASFLWSGLVNPGESLVVDTEAATCVVGSTNAYSGLDPTPDLFSLEPGANEVTITLTKPVDLVRTNYVTNPTFGNPTHGWTTSGTVAVDSGRLKVGPSVASFSWFDSPDSATRVLSGFSAEAGETFELRFTLAMAHALGQTESRPHRAQVSAGDGISEIFVYNLSDSLTTQDFVHTFTVPSSGELTITVEAGVMQLSGPSYYQYATYIDNIYIGRPGAYFDGGTTDTADITYAWTGTTNASTSTATPVDSDPHAEVAFQERDWMVV